MITRVSNKLTKDISLLQRNGQLTLVGLTGFKLMVDLYKKKERAQIVNAIADFTEAVEKEVIDHPVLVESEFEKNAKFVKLTLLARKQSMRYQELEPTRISQLESIEVILGCDHSMAQCVYSQVEGFEKLFSNLISEVFWNHAIYCPDDRLCECDLALEKTMMPQLYPFTGIEGWHKHATALEIVENIMGLNNILNPGDAIHYLPHAVSIPHLLCTDASANEFIAPLYLRRCSFGSQFSNFMDVCVIGVVRSICSDYESGGNNFDGHSLILLSSIATQIFHDQFNRHYVHAFIIYGDTYRCAIFTRVGVFISAYINITENIELLCKIMIGYATMDDVTLGYDMDITSNGHVYFCSQLLDMKNEYRLLQVITRSQHIVGKGSTCFLLESTEQDNELYIGIESFRSVFHCRHDTITTKSCNGSQSGLRRMENTMYLDERSSSILQGLSKFLDFKRADLIKVTDPTSKYDLARLKFAFSVTSRLDHMTERDRFRSKIIIDNLKNTKSTDFDHEIYAALELQKSIRKNEGGDDLFTG
ncbi:hypothetical protein V1514DRAFT_325565 [Lipomyces japonicus]|uniref:uncharacterized protein n=1 Tax=Lipomyces japonicus TaxID=56871 RepID=UPI0034CFC9F6